MVPDPSLGEDTLHRVDFTEGTLPDVACSLYGDLVATHGVQDVLVLTRFGTGNDSVRDRLRRSTGLVELPRVESLIRHAHETIDELPEPPRRLSSYERSYLFKQFTDNYDWTDSYLEKASEHDSFAGDVEQFSIVASWQGPPQTSDSVLGELTEAHSKFQGILAEQNYLEHANVIHVATDALSEPTVRQTVESDCSAIVVLEAEDYTTAELAYVMDLGADVPIHWFVTDQSSVQRIRNESGRIEPDDLGSGVEEIEYPGTDSGGLIEAVATQLTTGSHAIRKDQNDDSVAVLESTTFDEQIDRIASEIERLRDDENFRYDDIAVVLKDNRSPVRGIIDSLNSSGIPTASTTVSGMGNDPAVRELYTVVRAVSGGSSEDGPVENHGLLRTRVGAEPPLEDVRGAETKVDGIWEWIRLTDLKHRIAETESELDARAQFNHVRDVVGLAEFVDRSPLLDGTWNQLQTILEFAFEHAAPDDFGNDIDSAEGGVLVDTAQRVKSGTWKAVFVANAVDQEYPSEPRINRLFTRPHLNRIPEYPMVSAPAVEDVEATFATATDTDTRPYRAYYSHFSRRLMGIAARAADERLYFTTYRERRSDPGKYRRPSRYLIELLDVFPEISKVVEEEIRTENQAVNYALDSVDDALDRIRRAPTTDGPIDFNELEAEFGAIQRLLTASEQGDELAAAIAARADFSEGVVRRE